MVLPDLEVVVALHHPVQGLQRTHHELQQGRFACAVGSHQRDPRVLPRVLALSACVETDLGKCLEGLEFKFKREV